MREIRFRGKRIDNGEWVYGYYDCVRTPFINWMEEYGMGGMLCSAQVDPSTVGQYTGLKDKNGTEIYEGDIVKAYMDFGPGGMAEQVASIYWGEGAGGWQFNYFDKSTIEVIGNIHDNPELLGGAE